MTEAQGSQASESDWLSSVAKDTAKLALLLYLCGLLSFSFYYSRFRILSIDLARPEAVLIGLYIVLLFVLPPWIASRPGSSSGRLARLRIPALLIASTGLDLWILGRIGYHLSAAITLAIVAGILQLGLTILMQQQNESSSMLQRACLIGALIVCSINFSIYWLPRIPAYYGGGMPYDVQVFTKTPDLPANRFFKYKNQPQLNMSMDCFKLKLLYETDKDLYFVDELRESDNPIGYSVMRLKRDEVLRINYETPMWTRW